MLKKLLQALGKLEFVSEAEKMDFLYDSLRILHSNYKEKAMANEQKYKTMVDGVDLSIPNGTVGKDFAAVINLPIDTVKSFYVELPDGSVVKDGADGVVYNGLHFTVSEQGGICKILGKPEKAEDLAMKIVYKYPNWIEGRPMLSRIVRFAVNPDPKSMWKNIPTPTDIEYYKPDSASDYVKVESIDGVPQKDIVVASLRGRSHANAGIPRDDDFRTTYCPENGWYVMAVADGAGSAKYSRMGSKIACDTVVEYCLENLRPVTPEEGVQLDKTLEDAIIAYNAEKSEDNKKAIGDKIYKILGNAVFKAYNNIVTEAKKLQAAHEQKAAELTETAKKMDPAAKAINPQPVVLKDYATTLILAICKKFEFGWFIANFWVGDGAICLYNKENNTCRLLGVPDGGEFGGQTRFLTMKEVLQDTKGFYSRLRFDLVDDFTALFLMTDGVSDPKFETDARLADVECWNRFWEDLHGSNEEGKKVDLTDDNTESQYQLLEWIGFYSEGNHDDRTMAILY